ncbi:MAG TPA: MFS transporter [Allosphingosinicella sp.]|jgi:ACS family tartrate transporter-like MFS transporter
MSDTATSTAAKIRNRLALPAILFMLLSSLDRVNVSFAALQMNAELGFSPSQYGFGAGILFVGFLAGQYPSVLLLQRVGMGKWLAVIALVWGTCAGAMAFIQTPMQFYVLRVILGLAEGGLAPGIVLYLSQFATERERASTFATPMLAIPLSIVIGGPLSGWLMGMSLPGELGGWRWMFIAEAIPTIVLGLAALFYFPDGPDDARWLSPGEKDWLARNAANRPTKGQRNDWSMLRHPLVWTSALLWLCLLSGAYGIMFWLPQMVDQAADLSTFEIGLVNALPWLGVGLGIYFNSKHSDKTGERFWHVGLPSAVTAAALVAAWAFGAGLGGLVALFVAGIGLGAAQGAFWALPTTLLTPATMAVGVVAINICGSSGGTFMPHLVGYVREQTGSFTGPTFLVAGILLLAAFLVVLIRRLFFNSDALRAQMA